jgi:elongator complex protein 3
MKPPEKNEIRKPTKTLSGVTPIAVMVAPRKCPHGLCTYCPSLDVPQSYTPKSPPVIRAQILKYNPYEQVLSRLKAFELMNHPTDKIELIIMGGTFLSYPKRYQYDFIKQCYDALNKKKSSTLEKAKKINETAKNRCVALCIETRPDFASEDLIKRCLDFGATRVEIGVQAVDDKIYKKVNRGHTLNDVVEATKRFKNAGFKVGYHLMPGLPGSSFRKDLKMIKKVFSDKRFKPDQIKIYPCQVIKGAQLEKDFNKKFLFWRKFTPYSTEKTKKLLIEIFKIVPEYCRVMRVMRELPPEYIVAGTTRISLRKDVEEELRKSEQKIKEIRFREIGFAEQNKIEINQDVFINSIQYEASNGKEIFIQATNNQGILFGLLRLRIPFNQEEIFIPELKNSAVIRELHVYGKSLKLGQKAKSYKEQHMGLGKKLVSEAEEYVRKNFPHLKRIAIISGIGAREYYKKLNYKKEKNYMIKKIK